MLQLSKIYKPIWKTVAEKAYKKFEFKLCVLKNDKDLQG